MVAQAVITDCDNPGMLNTWEVVKMAAPSFAHNSSVISDDNLTDLTKNTQKEILLNHITAALFAARFVSQTVHTTVNVPKITQITEYEVQYMNIYDICI